MPDYGRRATERAAREASIPYPAGRHPTSTQNVRLCGKPVSRADGQLTVQNGGYARAKATPTVTQCDQVARDPRRAVPNLPQIIQPLDVQIARAVTDVHEPRRPALKVSARRASGSLCVRLYARRWDAPGGRASRVADELGPARQSIGGQLHAQSTRNESRGQRR